MPRRVRRRRWVHLYQQLGAGDPSNRSPWVGATFGAPRTVLVAGGSREHARGDAQVSSMRRTTLAPEPLAGSDTSRSPSSRTVSIDGVRAVAPMAGPSVPVELLVPVKATWVTAVPTTLRTHRRLVSAT